MKSRYIVIASVIVIFVGLYFVGRNANEAQRLAGQILLLDQSSQPVDQSKQALADFSKRHMGASTSVFLSGAYARAQAAANATGATGQVYQAAQAACVSRTSAVNQANCVQSYVASHSTPGSGSVELASLDASKFTYNYSSPRWTPDLAGGLLLLGVLGLVIAVVKRIRQ